MINCSIGICAYNEEKNISRLLAALKNQETREVAISEIIVVASGCTDKTEDIVRQKQADDPRIKLISQEKREGKAVAVNLYIANAKGEILVLISADTLPEEDAIEKMAAPFADPKVGITGGRPMPVNSKESFIGFCVNYMWQLHHLISLQSPKCGEAIAWRNLFPGIPNDSAVDEADIEKNIAGLGLKRVYVPEAVIRNKGPENISDFIKQRRRIYSGHMVLMREGGYSVSTLKPAMILKIIADNPPEKIKEKIWIVGMIFLEFLGRLLGLKDFYFKKRDLHIWDIAKTTKDL